MRATAACALMILLLLLAGGSGCGREEPAGGAAPPGEKIMAFVTIPPQACFAERVGGERVSVSVLVRAGQSPHTYDPSPRQMTDLAETDLYFLIGVPFEDVIKDRIKSVNPDMRLVDTSGSIRLRHMEEHLPGEGGHETEHAGHGRKDPHVWLDPQNAGIMAREMARALVELDPDHQAAYQANLNEFLEELDRLDADIRRLLQGVQNRKFLVFHPAFGYFAEAYGLQQVPIQIEGKEPSAKGLARLIEFARSEGIKVVFVQKQFSSESAEVVAEEIGGRVARVDPLARDYLENMRNMAEAFAEAMQ